MHENDRGARTKLTHDAKATQPLFVKPPEPPAQPRTSAPRVPARAPGPAVRSRAAQGRATDISVPVWKGPPGPSRPMPSVGAEHVTGGADAGASASYGAELVRTGGPRTVEMFASRPAAPALPSAEVPAPRPPSFRPPAPAAPAKVDAPPSEIRAARAAGVAVPPSHKLSAQSPLFRAEALAAYRRGERVGSVLRITSVSRWGLLSALALAVLIGVGLTAFGSVEETSRARGVLRAPFGVQPVVPLTTGTVREVLVESGAPVAAGQVIARLDATPLRAELQEAEQRLSLLTKQWEAQRATLHARHERSVALTKARIALIEQRRGRQEQRIGRREDRAARLHAPELDGVVEGTAREETIEALDGARDELLRLADEHASLELQLSLAESEYAAQIASGEQRVSEAQARRDAARVLLQQTELRAPIAGKLESVRAAAGQVVQAGQWFARVVREQVPETILAFAQERDAAFLAPGASATIEIDQLPVSEFGLAKARVVRVGSDLAEPSDLAAALGEAAPKGAFVRVELKLDTGADHERVRPLLRPGTLVTARIVLRDRRLLAIVFEPARRWLEP